MAASDAAQKLQSQLFKFVLYRGVETLVVNVDREPADNVGIGGKRHFRSAAIEIAGKVTRNQLKSDDAQKKLVNTYLDEIESKN